MYLRSLPGPYWTHVLFTWKSKEGLKVYVNGTLSTSDPSGKVSHTYGEPHVNLVIGSEQDQTKRYENEAFDEFIIWERALTPDEVKMYFTAAVGQCVGRAVGRSGVPITLQSSSSCQGRCEMCLNEPSKYSHVSEHLFPKINERTVHRRHAEINIL